MESVQPEQAANSTNRLGMSLNQPHIPDLGFSSSVCGIIDESFPYVSGIFDDTLNPSFMSNGPVVTSEIPNQLKSLPKNHEEQTVSNSWLGISVENSHQLDYSMSFTLPPNNNEDAANVTETNQKEELSCQPSSTSLQSCLEKCDSEVQSKNGTFNNSLKESSPGLNSTKPLLSESRDSNNSAELQEKSVGSSSIVSTENAGLEDQSEKHFNSTVDISGSASVTSVTSEHQATEKLDCTVDITQSVVPKQEQSSEKPGVEEKLDRTVDISQSNVVKQEQDKRLSSTERLNEKLDCTVEINISNVVKREQDNSRLSCSSREQPNKKLECSVAITQSDVPEQEQSLGLNGSKDTEKHCTFTKVAETNSIGDLTADMEKNSCASSHVSTLVGQPSSISLDKVDGTFTKHNATTDLTPVGSVSNSANATMNITKNPSIHVTLESSPNNVLEPVKYPVPVSTVSTVGIEIAVCSNRTLDFVEAESKALEQPDVFRRRKGISDSESCINLDISLSSMVSLDETLDMKATPLVASTPIVLSRGFDRLGSLRPTDMQQRLSVINNMDRHPNNDAASVSTNDGLEALKPPSIRSEPSSQIQMVSSKGTSNPSTSEPTAINKPPSKLAIRRKIPQPSKSNIPKTQISLRPPVSQLASVAGKPKSVAAAQILNQPKVSSSALHSMRRTAQLNNRKNLVPVKNTTTALTPKNSSLAVSGCNLTTDIKSTNTFLALPKSSGLQLPGRGRFGLKPAATEETGLSQTNRQTGLSGIRTRSSLLPGLSQKHASSDALPLAKRKKTDLQNQPPCAEAISSTKFGGGAQKIVATPTDLTAKGLKKDCLNCALLQDKLQTFHQELGGFLQELGRKPADCDNWTSFQQKIEQCLDEFKRLQAAHK